VFRLYSTLSNNATLNEFSFIQNWPSLSDKEKLEKYSQYACHELSFFLFKKDPNFFSDVIEPYLENKQEKTFLDFWLLNEDVKDYLQPFEFQKLNVAEKLLLAARISELSSELEGYIRDLFSAKVPYNAELFNTLFKTALKGRSLDTDVGLGFRAAVEQERAIFSAQSTLTSESTNAGYGGGMSMNFGQIASVSFSQAMEKESDLPAPPMPKMSATRKRQVEKELKSDMVSEELNIDMQRRQSQRQFYQKVDKTQEFAENNYYHINQSQQSPHLVGLNAFWSDYAAHNKQLPFVSRNFAYATANFTEMMFALALLDIPFTDVVSDKDNNSKLGIVDIQYNKTSMTIVPNLSYPVAVFHKEIKSGEVTPASVLVSQNFFAFNDRFSYENNEQIEKYVSQEFLTNQVYGCHVVITNVSMKHQKLDVLLQIPQGTLPVNNGFFTKSKFIELGSYCTTTVDFYFYFPFRGDFPHFPVHIAQNEKSIAFANPVTLHVVDQPTIVDTTSWEYISQKGTEEEVIKYLQSANIHRSNIALSQIAWRMKTSKDFFDKVIPILKKRFAFDQTLWSYSVYHKDEKLASEYLPFTSLTSSVGTHLQTRILTVDPFRNSQYEHLEYAPYINARAYTLGKERKILNDAFFTQYTKFLTNLCYKQQPNSLDLMAIAYYLLLQDRIEEAIQFFSRIPQDEVEPASPRSELPPSNNPNQEVGNEDTEMREKKDKKKKKEKWFIGKIKTLRGKSKKRSNDDIDNNNPSSPKRLRPETVTTPIAQLQYDYLASYLDFYTDFPKLAKKISSRYLDYPVIRWRKLFQEIDDQLKEIDSAKSNINMEVERDENDVNVRDRNQGKMASSEPTFDFKVESKKITIHHENLTECTISYFGMDIELMFSTNPFVTQSLGNFAWIKPNKQERIQLLQSTSKTIYDLPKEFHTTNVIVHITAAGISRSQPYYSQSLNVQLFENYGQMKVSLVETSQPLPQVYVKVYGKNNDGSVNFYKDGYTDLRGKFDYSSLSTNQMDTVQKFALLVMSEKYGAIIKEANPPKV